MFSSDNNSYPLFYHQSPSFTNVTPESSNNTFFQHHYYDHGNHNSNYFLPLTPTFSLIQENPIVKLSSEPSINQQNSMFCASNMKNVMPSSKRAPGKKDRHTKISTAQGVRDRRVRLSMNIARDFFNLQDMLGFDKASKTLGWLMAKSKAAIDELTNTSDKQNQETSIEDTNNEEVDDEKISLDAKSLSNKKRNRRENNLNGRNVSMEMKRREEARNRARERTRNKKFVDDQNNNNQLPQHQSSVQQEWMAYQSSSTTTAPCTFPYEIVSKGVSSKGNQETCNYGNVYLNKSTSESCTYGGFPEIHINARTWDVYSNQ